MARQFIYAQVTNAAVVAASGVILPVTDVSGLGVRFRIWVQNKGGGDADDITAILVEATAARTAGPFKTISTTPSPVLPLADGAILEIPITDGPWTLIRVSMNTTGGGSDTTADVFVTAEPHELSVLPTIPA